MPHLSVLLRYQELALKGKNRPWFQRQLVRHLHRVLAGLGVSQIRLPMGRVEVVLTDVSSTAEVRERIRHVFGIANFSVATRVAADLDALAEGILRDLPADAPQGFRVRARRADKQFHLRSPELERALGARVIAARGWPVTLEGPALTIGVEILPGEAFYHFGKEPGAGGLPTGTGGRVVVLLSGGIDSPVAAFRLMRRGCRATFVHFHGAPFHSRASQDKARQLVTLLNRYQLSSRLQLVPFGEIQRQVTLSVPSAMRVVVYRRLMLRIAARLAGQVRAHALVTGDVVGQVASQTIENIAATEAAVTIPVLRPLVGMDKEEITVQAERLGSYPISVLPDEDCCTLFTPRHPITRARLEEVEAAERDLPIEMFIDSALRESVVERFTWPPVPDEAGSPPPD